MRWLALAADLDVSLRDGRAMLDGRDVADALRTEDSVVRGLAGRRAPGAAPRVDGRASARSAGRRGWSPTAATWEPSFFRTPTLKVFLTASAEERAERRHKQLIAKGISVTIESLLRDIRERDARDSTRAAAPLAPAADAVILDTTDLSIAEVTDAVLALHRERPGAS